MRTADLFTPDLFTGALVRLTAPSTEDKPIVATWTLDTEYGRLMHYGSPTQPLSAEQIRMPGPDDGLEWKLFALRTVAENKLIGLASLFGFNWASHHCMFGIGIGEYDYRGRGYGTEATQLTIDFAFRELGMHRVGLIVFAYNERARRVYEKIGFVLEGTQREAMYKDGQRWDVHSMAILRPEWEAARAKKEG